LAQKVRCTVLLIFDSLFVVMYHVKLLFVIDWMSEVGVFKNTTSRYDNYSEIMSNVMSVRCQMLDVMSCHMSEEMPKMLDHRSFIFIDARV